MTRPGIIPPVAAALLLAACGTPEPTPELPVAGLPAFASAEIETDADGRCYGRGIEPAIVETIEVQTLEAPEVRDAAGQIVRPASYRSTMRQNILRDRREVRFETLCPPAYTAAFVQSLQRALAARGVYDGPIHGQMDRATGQAVQDFQRREGPDSPLLSVGSARLLGLVPLSAEDLASL